MSKLRVAAFSISLDGYGAGPDQRMPYEAAEPAFTGSRPRRG